MIPIISYSSSQPAQIFSRMAPVYDVSDTVASIIADVRASGDEALLRYTERFDHAKLSTILVTEQEFDEAMQQVDDEFMRILRTAAENIRAFHAAQMRQGFTLEGKDGVILGQRVIPVERAGLYVPGGTAAYPSTVLMDAIPAKLAGCREIVMVTPPRADGTVTPAILAAARVAGVTKVCKVGGAQAIAALAYGTESVPRVDKIVGPGNAFVAEAKKQVFGVVSIDMIAGPSEILVVADGTADPRYVAADLLSQAEHDKLASAVLVTDSMDLAVRVQAQIETQIDQLLRRDIARASIDNNGKILVTQDLSTAIDIANALAPEHLELCLDDPFAYLDRIQNAGSVFLGKYCPEALGDYYAGPNHTLPTGGSARFSSPLSVDDFIKKTQFIYYPEQAFRAVAKDVDNFARQEGLTAHGRSATIRLEAYEE